MVVVFVVLLLSLAISLLGLVFESCFSRGVRGSCQFFFVFRGCWLLSFGCHFRITTFQKRKAPSLNGVRGLSHFTAIYKLRKRCLNYVLEECWCHILELNDIGHFTADYAISQPYHNHYWHRAGKRTHPASDRCLLLLLSKYPLYSGTLQVAGTSELTTLKASAKATPRKMLIYRFHSRMLR